MRLLLGGRFVAPMGSGRIGFSSVRGCRSPASGHGTHCTGPCTTGGVGVAAFGASSRPPTGGALKSPVSVYLRPCLCFLCALVLAGLRVCLCLGHPATAIVVVCLTCWPFWLVSAVGICSGPLQRLP